MKFYDPTNAEWWEAINKSDRRKIALETLDELADPIPTSYYVGCALFFALIIFIGAAAVAYLDCLWR